MNPMLGILLIVPVLLTSGPAKAATPPTPVCRASTVVAVMTRQLQSRQHYLRLDPDSITEQPTANGKTVECGVNATVFTYDTPLYGSHPVTHCVSYLFSVMTVRNGYVVSFLR
jgi:hypothetical protein